MSAADAAHTYYESARQELIERIRLRDNSLFVYLGAVGALFGTALAKTAAGQILLVVPYLTLGAVFLMAQHHEVIGNLESYLVNELAPFLDEHEANVPQWNNSSALHAYYGQAMLWRLVAHCMLLLVPPAAALILNFDMIWSFPK